MWLCWLTVRNHVRLSLHSTTTIHQRAVSFSFTDLASFSLLILHYYSNIASSSTGASTTPPACNGFHLEWRVLQCQQRVDCGVCMFSFYSTTCRSRRTGLATLFPPKGMDFSYFLLAFLTNNLHIHTRNVMAMVNNHYPHQNTPLRQEAAQQTGNEGKGGGGLKHARGRVLSPPPVVFFYSQEQ